MNGEITLHTKCEMGLKLFHHFLPNKAKLEWWLVGDREIGTTLTCEPRRKPGQGINVTGIKGPQFCMLLLKVSLLRLVESHYHHVYCMLYPKAN
jgi:hypothetical protein